MDTLWRLYCEGRLDRRFYRSNEPAPHNAGSCGASAEPALRSRTNRRMLHCAQIHTICPGQVVKALGDAPGAELGVPGGQLFGEIFREQPGIALGRVELIP